MSTERVLPRGLLLTAAWLLLTASLAAQTAAPAPAFEVASIKPNTAGTGMIQVSYGASGFSTINLDIKNLILMAWVLKTDEQISGMPAWTNSAHYDINAKMDAETAARLRQLTPEQNQLARSQMLQALLSDRFKLKVHHETKDLPLYHLQLARSGLKIKPADPGNTYANGIKAPDGTSHPGMWSMGRGRMDGQAIAIAPLADHLSRMLHRQVIDDTGLTGKYDIALRWTPDDLPADSPETTGTSTAPSLFTALQEQLGLRLESAKGPVDTIVVDHIETPSEN